MIFIVIHKYVTCCIFATIQGAKSEANFLICLGSLGYMSKNFGSVTYWQFLYLHQNSNCVLLVLEL